MSAPTSVGVPVGGTVLVLGVLSVLLCLVSLAVGSHSLTLEEVAGAFVPGRTTVASVIVWQLRMPRTVLAVMVGASLAVAGVVMQGLTRNPLAEPGILGVNAGASLSVVLSMSLLGPTDVSDFLWFAFAGAALAACLVHLMSVRSADAGPARLVLAGVALGASLRSITGTITMYDSVTFDSYRFWVLGSLADRDAVLLVWVAPFLVVGLVLALASGLTLNALALGEEQAKALGVSPRRARADTDLDHSAVWGVDGGGRADLLRWAGGPARAAAGPGGRSAKAAGGLRCRRPGPAAGRRHPGAGHPGLR